jgi:hypothetical protein
MPNTRLSNDEVRSRVTIELKQLEAQAQQRVRTKGWRLLGRLGVKQAPPYRRAKSRIMQSDLRPMQPQRKSRKLAFLTAPFSPTPGLQFLDDVSYRRQGQSPEASTS